MAVVLPINNFLLLITTLTISLMLPTNVNSATLFNFTTFPKDHPDLKLQGNARISNGVLELTDHLIPIWNTGRALYAEPITIYDSTTGKLVSFQTTFSFVVEEWGANQHADGLAFFLVPDSDPNKIPSDSGTGNLGIINGNTAFNHLVAVEFDSYSNPWDPGFAHIGIDVNSLISLKTVRWNRKSGVLVQVSIVYDSASRSLSAVVTNDGGVLTTLSHSVDLRAVLPEKVVVGLSATTGIAAELHDIHSWSFVVSNFEDESSSSSTISPLPPQHTREPTNNTSSRLFLPHPNFFPPSNNNHQKRPSRLIKSRADTTSSAAATVSSDDKIREILRNRDYDKKFGFNLDIDSFSIPKGLSTETIRLISTLKDEPDWMLEFRLNAFERFSNMKEPSWSDNKYPRIDFQDMCYYSAPKKKPSLNSLDEADPELLRYFDKLGVPLNEQNRLANVAVDAVLDSVSIATTHRKTLEKAGVIFCSISEAIKEYPDLVKKYLGRVVPSEDNYYAALNSAVFSDGSFCYVPKGTKCPMQISTYFRINAMETGQFERTLIVADDESFVEYLEGCTAPSYDRNQLHAAVVELYCSEGAEIKYSTVQNWYAGDEQGNGGIYNFVTKRGLCAGDRSKISWTQVETGSAITWKYPSVVLEGDDTVGEFYSVALTNNHQQADTGTKMIHKGRNTRSRIISKGISVGNSRNCYRGLVQVQSKAENARNSSQCDSMLIGDTAAANTYPYIQVKNPTARIEHEASTSKIGEDQLFYFQQRGIDYEKAMAAMISGFCRDVFNELPDEFGSEVNQLMSLKLEGSVG